MRLPIQSLPVGFSAQNMNARGVEPQGCSVGTWIACAGVLALCAVSCIDPLDGVCEICLGSSAAMCLPCLGG